ncbi:DNA N-6-adenine-methyltransferase [Bacillus sp. FSL K6-0067]|uniref:DNA N-6-adenine-methyltransferase n=1 Tax=Bacillus sp. FSL K6-0067 TaxID=2921412 RepID=UPI00077A9FC2|nr:DNA N-6-adenine-methyltransferase [Bacillus cereus]KXY25723.1 adenine methyltransferase [Bacillus cereus]
MNTATLNTLFSSETDLWNTPKYFYDILNEEFSFTLDPCTDGTNAKCTKYFTKEDDGLVQDWSDDIVFMNPPYGRVLADWVRKAYEESQKGATIVCLIPARTDTRYWHDYVMKAKEVRLIKGRLKFGGSKNSAPFPSAVVVFEKGNHTPIFKAVSSKGA